jgi:hypothetical protein
LPLGDGKSGIDQAHMSESLGKIAEYTTGERVDLFTK